MGGSSTASMTWITPLDSFNIGGDNLYSIVQVDVTHIGLDGDLLAFKGGIGHLAIQQRGHIGSHHLTRNNVVKQDVGQTAAYSRA